MRQDLIISFPSFVRRSFRLTSIEDTRFSRSADGRQDQPFSFDSKAGLDLNPEAQILKGNSHNAPSGDWLNRSIT